MNDCITTTKQSTAKPCAYFLGYTVVMTKKISIQKRLFQHVYVRYKLRPLLFEMSKNSTELLTQTIVLLLSIDSVRHICWLTCDTSNSLRPDGTRIKPESLLTIINHMVFTLEQFHNECQSYYPV